MLSHAAVIDESSEGLFSVKRLSGKSYRCHITFQYCEICNLVLCSFSVKCSRVRGMVPEQDGPSVLHGGHKVMSTNPCRCRLTGAMF